MSETFLYDINPYTPARRTYEPRAEYEQPLTPVRHLLVVEDSEGQRLLSLESTSHSLGRDPTNSIVLQSKAVSRQHAMLLRVTSSDPNSYGFLIIDGNLQGKRSTNGIKVNGQKCHSHRLKHEDFLLIGNQVRIRYLVLQNLTDDDFAEYSRQVDFTGLLQESEHPISPTIPPVQEQESDEASLLRLASFPEIIPSPMFEINLNGELTYFNPAAASIFPDLAHLGMEHPMLEGLFSLVQQSRSNVLVREVAVDQQVFEQSIHYISESDLIRSCVFDITERKHAESELRKRDRLLQSVAEATTHLLANVGYDSAINEALATLGNSARVDRICITMNHSHPTTGDISSSMRFEWVQDEISSILRSPHRHNQPYRSSAFKRWYHLLTDEKSISGLTHNFPEAEKNILLEDGVLSVLVVPIIVNHDFWGFIELHQCSEEYEWSFQEESVIFAMAASISAALQRQETEEIIHHQAFHDALTSLPNRVLFNDRLDLALATARRNEHSLAVMFLDLDRFKIINDTLGHSIGDALLNEVAQRLQTCLRDGDTIARWGGDEFTVLLPQIHDVEDATNAASRILNALKTPFRISQQELFVDTSIGIALYPQDSDIAETLLQNADVALYRCKEQGRGGYRLYSPTMNSKAPELFVLENSLRHALERDEFIIYYQPKVDALTGFIVGLEALVRWEHPELGLISPAVFIPLAEETGLIVEIGTWVLQTACDHVVQWHRAGLCPLSIAVNLSARQFFQPDLVKVIAQALAQSQLDPQYLELEITETIAVKHMEFSQSVLQQIQDMGVHIAMDDFGTGYSSLNYLKQLPLNTLKIDRSFICDLKPNSKDLKIVDAVIALGQGLDLKVVAEGVETAQQVELLRQLNCDILQGYLFSRPITFEKMTEMLKTNWLQRQQQKLMILN
ncbi:MAG: EAL domain-containing protein [Thermosynechococcaceae cyanobacterium MS004]|nr:EAL domain-containing protein [Thermosynechococcaceae cyanobacterium MS004]